MIELPLLEGLSTHYVIYDSLSLHVTSLLLFLRLLASVSTRASGFTYLHWYRTSITHYTIGVIHGVWGCGFWGCAGARRPKWNTSFWLLSSIYLFLYPFSFHCFARTCHVFGFCDKRTRGMRMVFPVIFLLLSCIFMFSCSYLTCRLTA